MMLSQTLKAQFLLLGITATQAKPRSYEHKGLPLFVQKATALLALILVSPLMFTVALLLKFESRGPVFFTQTRIGETGRHFTCYKIRSMYLPSDP